MKKRIMWIEEDRRICYKIKTARAGTIGRVMLEDGERKIRFEKDVTVIDLKMAIKAIEEIVMNNQGAKNE